MVKQTTHQRLRFGTPKYRYRVLEGKIKKIIEKKIKQVSEWYEVEIEEINVMGDHILIVCWIPPKMSISKFMGVQKGKAAIDIFSGKCHLKEKPYWGNHFYARGYIVTTLGINEEVIKRYVKDQKQENDNEQYKLFKS